MKWLIHPIETIKSWGVKSYLLGIVNGAIEKYNESVTKARWYVTLYITKVEALLEFLKSLDKKLEDSKLTEDEAKALCAEAVKLAKDLTAKQ